MRIAILADPIDNQQAGIHYYTREFLTHLGQINTKNEYLAIRMSPAPQISGIENLVVRNYPKIPGYKAYRMFLGLPRKLSRMKVDVVVEPAHFGPFNLPSRIKRVTVIHDLTPIKYPHFHRFHSQFLQRIFLKGILKRASLIIANSRSTYKDIIEYLPSTEQKAEYIYLGKDPIFINTLNEDLLNDLYGIDYPYCLYIGTIEPRKNLLTLLKAFEILKKEHKSNLHLVIGGQVGWRSEDFFKELDNHPFRDDINLMGYIPREIMPLIYSHARVFVFPSLYEGFGMPVLEAMSCGTPCIVADNSSLPEVGGLAADTFEPKDFRALAGLIQGFESNDAFRKERSDLAMEQASQFSWDNYVKEFDLLMTNLPKR
ncbi:MAG: glycosyltransferase family 1 protein [Bacteroidota bacterium]|nr:glycosyltransferase family 1 protein [Bacteroidota bacterium]